MNRVKILRLPEGKREEYIRSHLVQIKKPDLVHMASEAGAIDAKRMSRDELINLICDGLLWWASKEELE